MIAELLVILARDRRTDTNGQMDGIVKSVPRFDSCAKLTRVRIAEKLSLRC